jgi:hypothetical protein
VRFALVIANSALACLLLVTSGCQATQSQPRPHSATQVQSDTAWVSPAKPSTQAVHAERLPPSVVIAKAQRHPPEGVGRRVIRDSATWQRVWTQLHSVDEQQPLPNVDFRREMVLAASAYVLEPPDHLLLDSIGIADDSVVAVVTLENGCAVVPAVGHMTLLVRVPRVASPVRFLERMRQGPDCSRMDR